MFSLPGVLKILLFFFQVPLTDPMAQFTEGGVTRKDDCRLRYFGSVSIIITLQNYDVKEKSKKSFARTFLPHVTLKINLD
jgi:hypothetical protein